MVKVTWVSDRKRHSERYKDPLIELKGYLETKRMR